MEKQNYLVKIVETFYDGHGEGSNGSITLEVSDNGEYGELKEGQEYTEELEEVDEHYERDNDLYAQDGYHCCQKFITIKKITPEEALNYTRIISEYNNIIL